MKDTKGKRFVKRHNICKLLFALCISMCGFISCTTHPDVPAQYQSVSEAPSIYPDYTDVTIPCNIAPLNFMVKDAAQCVARISWKDNTETYGVGNKVQIPVKEWAKMIGEAKGSALKVELFTKAEDEEEWKSFQPFAIRVAEEGIDEYLSYRLISPSYVAYEMLSINQRNLTNFDEKVIYNNMLVSDEEVGQCINCHSYQNYETDNMQFHMRQGYGGTMIVNEGTPQKVNLKTDKTISSGVYPAWHPEKKLIAYSTNKTGQTFHTKDISKIEVQDTESDLILYDVEKNEVFIISNEMNEMESFPAWSPKGDMLYYVSANFVYADSSGNKEGEISNRYKEVKYDIYRRTFDSSTRTFGEKDTVYLASAIGQSATLPRISPDGKYLLFTQGEFGTFHIWHPDADLYLMDLANMQTRKLENINSDQTESYHSWSSNGRWIVVSSRRDDGNYTRPYISYFDASGKAHKAFALPQEDPEFYINYMRSYNIPEFMKEPVEVTPHEFAAAAKKDAIQAVQR